MVVRILPLIRPIIAEKIIFRNIEYIAYAL